MNAHFARAELLYSQDRYELAEAECRKALAEMPEHPGILGLLALTLSRLKRHDEALSTARDAIGCAPDEPYTHYCLSLVHAHREELQLAQEAVSEAIRLDPEDADFRGLQASIHLGRREYREALAACEGGLELDPEHEQCMNLKAMALTQLGRKEEAARTIRGALQRDPDNAWTHANQGWALLHQNRPKQAAEHFREALRIDPSNGHAQQGMLNALRAKNPLFRVMLAYFLWMSRLSAGAQWGVIIGLYIGAKLVGNVARDNPEYGPWLLPVLILYLVFVYLSWTAGALSNLLLRLSPYGRFLLDEDDIRASNYVGGALLLAVVFGVAALLFTSLTLGLTAGFFMMIVIPISGTYSRPEGDSRRLLELYTLALIVLGVLAIVLMGTDSRFATIPGALFLLGMFAFGWIANAISIRKPA